MMFNNREYKQKLPALDRNQTEITSGEKQNMSNVNHLKCSDVDAILKENKTLIMKNDRNSIKEMGVTADFFESEAVVNAGIIKACKISHRMLVCSQNATLLIAKNEFAGAIGEIWDIIDYHEPDEELSVVDIMLLSLLTGMLYNQIAHFHRIQTPDSVSANI